MESETCVIKDTVDADPCGEDVCAHLTNVYTFDSGEHFEFTLGLCKDHQEALIQRYSTEFPEVRSTP